MALSSSKQHSRISSDVTIRFFQPNDRAACQKIFVDGSNECWKDTFLLFLTRITWYFAVGAVPASFTAIIWSPWVLAVYFLLAFLFFVCPIIYWFSDYKSWQKSRLSTKFSLSDGGQIWVAELKSKVVGSWYNSLWLWRWLHRTGCRNVSHCQQHPRRYFLIRG